VMDTASGTEGDTFSPTKWPCSQVRIVIDHRDLQVHDEMLSELGTSSRFSKFSLESKTLAGRKMLER
jgi:hypothetical protein